MTGGAGAQTTTLDGNRASLEAALTPAGRWVGAALPRKEDRRMLTGRGRFTGDYARPGMLHAAFARSPFAAAAVGAIDVAAAVSAQVTDGFCDAVRVVLGGVGTRPLLLDTDELAGAPATAATWQAAGELAAAAIDPPSDGHGSGDYRKRLAATLVTRALTQATIGATGA